MAQRLKIAFVIKSLKAQGGSERACTMLANELSERHEIFILTTFEDISAYPLSENVRLLQLPGPESRVRTRLFSKILALRKLVLEHRFDVVIGVGRGILPIFPFMMTGTGSRAIFWEHNSIRANSVQIPFIKKLAYYLCVPFIVDHVVVLNRQIMDNYGKAYRFPHAHVSFIYNFAEKRLFEEQSQAYKSDSKAIITVGRMVYQKGYEYLVEVADKVLRQLPQWRWDIYGALDEDQEYAAKIRHLIDEKGLSDRIVLKGKDSNIYARYADYAMLVMTSRFEGMPMVLLEAKAKGLPIVSFDIETGPGYMVSDGNNGYLVEPFDTDMMAQKIIGLAEGEKLRSEFSLHAREGLDEFSAEQVAAKWNTLFNQVLEQDQRGFVERLTDIMRGGVNLCNINYLKISAVKFTQSLVSFLPSVTVWGGLQTGH